jgi:2-polyprenyl-6-methoxyphenol hydroxylase-like FAD-dependent oxidoreductase
MARPPELRETNLVFGGPLGAVGFCPISEQDGYLYIVEAAPDNPRLDTATLHLQMQARLTGYGGFVPEMAAQLTDPAKVSYRPLEWHLAPSPWFKNRVVVIGDAAHCNPPVLAQGAAMGIEDAVVLAQSLQASATIEAGLAAFMQRRFERARQVVETSVQLAQWEVDHKPGVDVPGVMAAIQAVLAEPF